MEMDIYGGKVSLDYNKWKKSPGLNSRIQRQESSPGEKLGKKATILMLILINISEDGF